MTAILTTLSALFVPVFGALLAVAAVEAVDISRQLRCLHSAEADMRPPRRKSVFDPDSDIDVSRDHGQGSAVQLSCMSVSMPQNLRAK